VGKIQKTITLIAVAILFAFLLRNFFSKADKPPFNPDIYSQKLKPISFPKKQSIAYEKHSNDIALQYTRLWGLPELYGKSSKRCLENFADQHPNNLVQNNRETELYGIEIGTQKWFELTDAFERYASNVCYSFSGYEMEIVYANSLKETLSDDELTELIKLFNTDLGKKTVQAIKVASEKMLEAGARKQRNESNSGIQNYYNTIELLQKTNN
jgi:hypothetical protein